MWQWRAYASQRVTPASVLLTDVVLCCVVLCPAADFFGTYYRVIQQYVSVNSTTACLLGPATATLAHSWPLCCSPATAQQHACAGRQHMCVVRC